MVQGVIRRSLRKQANAERERQKLLKATPVSQASITFLRKYRKNRTIRDLEFQRTQKKLRIYRSNNPTPLKQHKNTDKENDIQKEEDEVVDMDVHYTGLEYDDLVFVASTKT